MKKHLTKQWVVISIAIFCAILWGSAFPVLKISYIEMNMAAEDTMAKVVFAGMRFFLAGLLLLGGLLIINRGALKISRRQIPIIILFGILQTALQYYFFYNGLAKTSGMQGAILVSSGTFFTVILSHYFYVNDRMDIPKLIGLIAGFAGIALSNWGEQFELSFSWTGEGYMILSGLTGAIGTIMAKELAQGIHPFSLTGWQLTIGAGIMLLIGTPQLQQNAITFTPLGWGLLLYSAILSAVAFALWYSLLKYNKAGEISIYKFMTPVSGAILSAIFIPEEELTTFVLAGILLVALGFLAINLNNLRQKIQKSNSSL